MATCKVRRALYARITLDMFRVGSFRAAMWAFDAHEATCPLCRMQAGAISPNHWRRLGQKRLARRYEFAWRSLRRRYVPRPVLYTGLATWGGCYV